MADKLEITNNIRTLRFFAGEMTSAFDSEEIGVTPAKSFTVSKGSFAKVEGLTVCEDEWIMMV